MARASKVEITALEGRVGKHDVLLGFAPAAVLRDVSFSDEQNIVEGSGYQPPPDPEHAHAFGEFLRSSYGTAPPLIFNLRSTQTGDWQIIRKGGRQATLKIRSGKVLSLVDGQHRLRGAADQRVDLAFMAFIDLNVDAEKKIFHIINQRARGVRPWPLQADEAARVAQKATLGRPETLITLELNERSESPWYRELRTGRTAVSGMMRRATFATMQRAVKKFLRATETANSDDVALAREAIFCFWEAAFAAIDSQWKDRSISVFQRGAGVYALMAIAAELYQEAKDKNRAPIFAYFRKELDFINDVSWSTSDKMWSAVERQTGVNRAVEQLKRARRTWRGKRGK